MKPKPTREQLPFYNRFIQLTDNRDFIEDVNLLRQLDAGGLAPVNSRPSTPQELMSKYNLPFAMERFIYRYITHDEVKLELLHSGVYVVDLKNKEASGLSDNERLNYYRHVNDVRRDKYIHLTLAIPVNATVTQINATISEHKQFIKDRQAKANQGQVRRRVRPRPKAARNQEIMKLYYMGLKPSKILWELTDELRGELTAPEIAKIIDKQKNAR